MTESSARDRIQAGADSLSLALTEGWYREHCAPIAEICITQVGTHRHAVIVPDFALIRKQRHPNSRELIRFAFHETSKELPIAGRPDTFSVRSTPLPRTANGRPDRERLRNEIADQISAPAKALPTLSGPSATTIAELIRYFRPEVICELKTNLELDLGFDSLDRILLIASVEKMFGVSIAEPQVAEILTVGDLIEAVQQRMPESAARTAISWSDLLRPPLHGSEQSLADSILKNRSGLTFLAWSFAQSMRVAYGNRFQFEVLGREWILPDGPYLIAANHCSHLDPLFLLWALPYPVAKRLSFMGHTEYFGEGWKAALAKRLKLIPVDPDEHAGSGMRLAAEALRRRMIGMVFPEGERSPNGAQQSFHRGLVVLAREMRVPILPVAICGTYEVLPRGRDEIRHAPVQVRFGAPLRAESAQIDQDLLARLWKAIRDLRGTDAQPREPVPFPVSVEWGPTS